jgi:hypothetical protein
MPVYVPNSDCLLSTLTLDERIESVVEKKLSAFAAYQNDLLSRLQERLQLTESRLDDFNNFYRNWLSLSVFLHMLHLSYFSKLFV